MATNETDTPSSEDFGKRLRKLLRYAERVLPPPTRCVLGADAHALWEAGGGPAQYSRTEVVGSEGRHPWGVVVADAGGDVLRLIDGRSEVGLLLLPEQKDILFSALTRGGWDRAQRGDI